jgi:DNA-binding transcriptional MerR regulator
MSRDGFSTREVLELTGTTARQLQWWDEKRIIVPARDGRRRIYCAEDLIQIHIIEKLRHRGISLATARRVLRFLRREIGDGLSEFASSQGDYHLMLDGKNIYLETDPEQIVNLIRHSTRPVFVISLSEAVRQVLAVHPLERKFAHVGIRKPPVTAKAHPKKEEAKKRAG